MLRQSTREARLTIAASFPPHFFLENLALRDDNSMLVTAVMRKELYYVPRPSADREVKPVLLHTFNELAWGALELERDVFAIFTGNDYTTHEAYLYLLDLRGWLPGAPVTPELIFSFPKGMLAPNGCCLLTPQTILVANMWAGSIVRLDLPPERTPQAKVWLQHESMKHIEDTLPPPPQPGINGLRYSAKRQHVYYTNTGQKLFMRVRIDSDTFEPISAPERLASGGMYDDFCIDDENGVAYLTVHRENRIDRAPIEPDGEAVRPIVGEPLDEMLLGPTSAVWGRMPGEYGRVAYVTTDGGLIVPPPDGKVRPAKVLRMEIY
jgi:hypothetical protein